MSPEDFLSLPPNVALGILLQNPKLAELVASTEKPRGPLPPRFDRKLRRKGGMYVWASESSLESIVWQLGRAKDSAAAGGQYADKDAKEAEQLERWAKWRSWYPHDRWQGTRGNVEVSAMPPSKHPTQHAWEPRPQAAPQRGDAYEDAGQGDDDFPPENHHRF